MNWIFVSLGIVANAAASAFIKSAAGRPMEIARPITILTNWRLLASVLLYGGAFVFYALAISRMPLNIAQPVFTAGAMVLVAIISAVAFREHFTTLQLVGYSLLLAGIVLVGWTRSTAS